jgi:hypothetical protein
MPSNAVFPVMADVKTLPSVTNVATSVTPDAIARAVRTRPMAAMYTPLVAALGMTSNDDGFSRSPLYRLVATEL